MPVEVSAPTSRAHRETIRLGPGLAKARLFTRRRGGAEEKKSTTKGTRGHESGLFSHWRGFIPADTPLCTPSAHHKKHKRHKTDITPGWASPRRGSCLLRLLCLVWPFPSLVGRAGTRRGSGVVPLHLPDNARSTSLSPSRNPEEPERVRNHHAGTSRYDLRSGPFHCETIPAIPSPCLHGMAPTLAACPDTPSWTATRQWPRWPIASTR